MIENPLRGIQAIVHSIMGTPEQRDAWKLAGRIRFGIQSAPVGPDVAIVTFKYPPLSRDSEERVIAGDVSNKLFVRKLRFLGEQLGIAADQPETSRMNTIYTELYNLSERRIKKS